MTPENNEEKPHGPQENTATVTVSLEKPEMANIQGLFVMSIPINSKMVNRVVALGFSQLAVFRLNGIYEQMEMLKRENEAKIKKGDLSMLSKIGGRFGDIFKR